MLLKFFKRHIPTFITIIVILAVWQIWADVASINPLLLPSPLGIAQSMVYAMPTLWPAMAITIEESVIGFILAIICGITLGIVCYSSKILRSSIFPILYAAQTMPLISIAPILLLWFGFEISGKIVIVAIFGLFPIAVQTIRGLQAVPRYYSDVALTCGATQTWTLWHVKLRVAGHSIFGGIRIAGAYTIATATTAEYLGSRG
ncbi:MAG: ABC transporter permease subunit, partial [Bifidobacteriaceae bacterium]|nr:ABC transporter permease subunit [Bifidobacteriaceae bacterium]